MDLDFLLITLIYLVVILSTHMYLKKYDNYNRVSEIEDTDELDHNSVIQPQDTSNHSDNEEDLIINTSELNENTNLSANEFIKYLEIEDSDTNEALQGFNKDAELSDDIDTRNTLDKYFKNVKEENGELIFDPVPTSDTLEHNPKGLLTDIKKLNDDNVYDNVNAFDDFDATYAPI